MQIIIHPSVCGNPMAQTSNYFLFHFSLTTRAPHYSSSSSTGWRSRSHSQSHMRVSLVHMFQNKTKQNKRAENQPRVTDDANAPEFLIFVSLFPTLFSLTEEENSLNNYRESFVAFFSPVLFAHLKNSQDAFSRMQFVCVNKLNNIKLIKYIATHIGASAPAWCSGR